MIHRVFITPRAQSLILEALKWYEARDAGVAQDWYEGLSTAIQELGRTAESHPMAVVSERFPVPLREFHYGLGPNITHRVFFVIRPEGVFVYGVWHVARDDPHPSDF